jgi:arylsulfatase
VLTIALVAGLAAWLAGCSRPRAVPHGKARRVILITCDTLRADRLGAYGYRLPTSPSLDAFAAESIVFDEAYTTAPWTKPALAALLTGRTPDEIGMADGNMCELSRDSTTLAEFASAAGYDTAAFVSNWMLRRSTGELHAAGLAQGFDLFDDEMQTRELNRETSERDTRATTDAALEQWLAPRCTPFAKLRTAEDELDPAALRALGYTGTESR